MADTVRKQILNTIATLLARAGFATVQLQRISPIDLETLGLPAVFVYAGKERREESTTIGRESFVLEVEIEVWGKEEELEELLGLVHLTLAQDMTLGGKAVLLQRRGADSYIIDPERSLGGMLITYEVLYSHVEGDPYSH